MKTTQQPGFSPRKKSWPPRCHHSRILRVIAFAAALFASGIALRAQSFAFHSSAGYGGQGSTDSSGPSARFYLPAMTAVDAAGNIYVTDSGNHTIRKIDVNGLVTTVAGFAGTAGYTNGIGTNALFNQPAGIGVDPATNLYVADSGNQLIRKISSDGTVTTLAGSPGISGSVDNSGSAALFNQPQGIAVDDATNVYVADYGNHTIREISPAGAVATLAGFAGNFGGVDGAGTNASFYQPQGVAVDAARNVYVADTANGTIRKITSAGVVTTIAGFPGNLGNTNDAGTNASFYQPEGIAVDAATNLYVADYFDNTIRKITPAGGVTTFAGSSGTFGSLDGVTNAARFWGPQGLVADGSGNLYVADRLNGTIRKITPAGTVTTVAGSASAGNADGPNPSARFSLPEGVAVDTASNVYVADTLNSTIRKITPAGQVSTFAGVAGSFGISNGPGTNALFAGPRGVATDTAGNVYVADTQNSTIRKITPDGTAVTFAGYPGYAGSLDGAGTNAQFDCPEGIAVDSANNVYVADTRNNTIRKITSEGVVSTLAGLAGYFGNVDGTNSVARFHWPKGVAVDGAGQIYVGDFLNHTLRAISPTGMVSTLAGWAGIWGSTDGTNSDARFYEPTGVAVDGAGNVYVADSGNHTLRRVSPSGTNWVVSTIAGLAGFPGSAEGTGPDARFDFPGEVALDGAGNLYVADAANDTVRLSASLFVPITIANVSVVPRLNSAIISWSTAVPATTQAAYGLTPAYGSLTPLTANLATNHAVLLTGLLARTNYYFQLVSTTASGSETSAGNFSTAVSLILQSSNASYTGVWYGDSSAPDRFSPVYQYALTVPGGDTVQATFQPAIITPGLYDVYLWYSADTNRSLAAPATISFSGGTTIVSVNESIQGGSWQLLARNEPFDTGTNGFVRLGNGTGETGKWVIADAVQWVYSPGQDLPANGNVPGWWANFYFGTSNINASLPGANGYSLLSDYILGFSPIDPTASLAFNIRPAAQGFQAVFSPLIAGREYQLQAATNLLNPVWTNVPNLTVIPANEAGIIADTNVTETLTFYRLTVQLTP